jgi:hypothetical protein
MRAVDTLDFETLSRREDGKSDEDDDNECVDFNEEEVLKRCQGIYLTMFTEFTVSQSQHLKDQIT